MLARHGSTDPPAPTPRAVRPVDDGLDDPPPSAGRRAPGRDRVARCERPAGVGHQARVRAPAGPRGPRPGWPPAARRRAAAVAGARRAAWRTWSACQAGGGRVSDDEPRDVWPRPTGPSATLRVRGLGSDDQPDHQHRGHDAVRDDRGVARRPRAARDRRRAAGPLPQRGQRRDPGRRQDRAQPEPGEEPAEVRGVVDVAAGERTRTTRLSTTRMPSCPISPRLARSIGWWTPTRGEQDAEEPEDRPGRTRPPARRPRTRSCATDPAAAQMR